MSQPALEYEFFDNQPEPKKNVLYTLSLRGESINEIIDAATPLLGMVLRLHDIQNLDDNPLLYQQIVTDITAIEQRLQDKGYEPGMIVTFRYVFCTFIDEVAMKYNWDSETNWRRESLLVHFHNEAWGGEKTFVLLDRLMAETKRYKDLLEFIYLCFCLGFKGRYALHNANIDEYNNIIKRLHDQLQKISGDKPKHIVYNKHFTKINNTPYELIKRVTRKQLIIGGLIFLFIIFGIYSIWLDHQSRNILEQLNMLLR